MTFSTTPTDSNNIPIGCVYVPGVGFKALQGGTATTDAASNDSAPVAVTEVGGTKATYTVNYWNLIPTTGATDIFTITGSATKTVKITRVEFSMTITSPVMIDLMLLKRSTANTAGTTIATNLTTTSHDSANAAPTATVLAYTANPGLGTIVGNIGVVKYLAQAATIVPVTYIREFGIRPSQQPTLHGITQVFAINLNAIGLGGGQSADMAIEFTEE